MVRVQPPAGAEEWLALTEDVLDVDAAYSWVVRADCGAVVVFSGTVRDHAEGRPGVSGLRYEAYEEQVVPKLAAIAAAMREQWPVGRILLWHRTGDLALTECSVVVAVSSGHRAEAFEAARFGIEAIKASVPIWKEESWAEGEAWALGARPVVGVEELSG